MKKITFIAEAGRLDSSGDQINIDGLSFKEVTNMHTTILTKDFDYMQPIGRILEIYKEGKVLKIDAEIIEEAEGYPAIAYAVVKSTKNIHGGRDIQEAILQGVSICRARNSDSLIKKIT